MVPLHEPLPQGQVSPTARFTWSPGVSSSASSGMISTLALESLTVAFTVASATPCPTDPVDAIAPDAKPGISVNPLSESVLSVASVDPARVTTRARQFEQCS